MKYSKSAIGLLTAQYRSVLKKCWLINVGLFALGAVAATPANAADTWQGAIDGTTAFMDSITGTEWDRSKPITGWGVDQVLGIMGGAATATDSAVSLVNDASKGNNALYSKVNTLESDLNTAEGKISSLETSVGTKAESSTVTTLAGRVTAAEGNISDLQTNKADKTTVNTISGKVSALETAAADMATKTWIGEQGYQTSTDVTNAIKNSIENTTGPNTIGKAIADATDGMLTSTNYTTTLDSVYAKVGDVPTKTSQLTNDSDYTTLAAVVADAANTTDGHLGKAIADTTDSAISASISSGAIKTALDDKADKATTLTGYGITDGANTDLSNISTAGQSVIKDLADGQIEALDATASQTASTTNPLALTVTQADGVITGVSGSIATDGTTIAVNNEGKLEVNSITAAKVSDFDTQVESDISSSISTSGKALNTALGNKQDALTSSSGNAGNGISITDAGVISAKAGDTTITVDGDGIKVGSITAAKVSDFDTQVESDISTSISTSGKALNTALGNKSLNINAASLQVNDVDVATISGTQTLTNKTIDADNNSISNLETDNFKSGVIQTTVRAVASASDTALASEKAVATAIKGVEDVIGSETSGYAAGTALAGKTIGAGAATDVTVASAIGTLNNAIKDNADVIGAGKIGTGAGEIAGTAGNLTGKTIGTTYTVTQAIADLNATNVNENSSLNSLAGLVNGGSVDAATGAYTPGSATLTGFSSATNLTAAANELMTDITVTAGQVTTTNHLTAGANLAGNVVAVANSLASTEALVGTGSAPAAGTGILAGKTITGTAGTNNLNMVDAISYVAANGAGLGTNNVYTGTNTYGSTSGSQVIIDNGGNLTANTSLKVGTATTNMLTVSSSGTTIGAANAIVGTAGSLDMGGNSLSNVHGLTLTDGTGHTNDATISVNANGINTGNKTLDVGTGALKSETLYVGTTDQFSVNGAGNISTSGTLDVTGTATVGSLAIGTTGKGFDATGNLTAGTISATGINTTTANTVSLGGTGFTTAVTGDMTVSGDTALSGKLNVTGDTTLANTSVTGTLDVAGNTTLKNTSVDGTLDVTGKSTFGNASGSRIELNGGALTVKDSTQAVVATIDNDGNADFKGTLGVTGLASLDGGINVNDVFDVNATTGVITLSDTTTPTPNTATMAMTQIKDSTGADITNVLKVDGTGLYTGYVASESGFTVAQKDAVTGLYKETFTVNAGGEITGVGLTTDKTNGVDLGVAGTTTDIIGSAINIGGAATTTANLLAGTNGVNVSATGTDITGNFSVATNKFTVDSTTGNTAVAGTMDIEGDTTIGNKFSVTATDGSMSAAGSNFTVDANGAITSKSWMSVADGNFKVNSTGGLTTTSWMSVADGNFKVNSTGGLTTTSWMSVADGKMTVNSDGAIKAADGNFTVDKDGNVTAQGNLGVYGTSWLKNTNVDGALAVTGTSWLKDAVVDGALAVTGDASVAKNFTVAGQSYLHNTSVDGDLAVSGTTKTTALTFDGTSYVAAMDQGDAAITSGVVDDQAKRTMATVATVAKTIGKLDDKNAHGVTNVSDVASAIATLSTNVETATGGTFAGAVWTGNVTVGTTTDYAYATGYHDIMSAVSQVASNIGNATTVTNNGALSSATVNANIDAINKRIGDVDTIGYGYKNLSNGTTTQPSTVVEALQNIDASMGTIHGLAAKLEAAGTYQGNLAQGTTVEQHLTALDTSIGDRSRFANMNYTKGAKSVVDAVGKLDNKLYSLDHDVRTMRHHYDSALASAAALSALVPNARAHGNTQLSLGTGMYHGHGAMAVGGFHWVTDNLLFNTGVAWDDNEATYRMGVTYSW